jgi:hypothetical protein
MAVGAGAENRLPTLAQLVFPTCEAQAGSLTSHHHHCHHHTAQKRRRYRGEQGEVGTTQKGMAMLFFFFFLAILGYELTWPCT